MSRLLGMISLLMCVGVLAACSESDVLTSTTVSDCDIGSDASCEPGFECRAVGSGAFECIRAESADMGGQNSDDGGASPDLSVDMMVEDAALADCGDGVQNGNETGVDCGGSCPLACEEPEGCSVSAECTTGQCVEDQCVEPSCTDGEHNGLEGDVDCGGDCAPCADDMSCFVAFDCQSGVCVDGVCQAEGCDDLVQNGGETGADCGGRCSACADGLGCAVAGDCNSGVCSNAVCQAPVCDDIVQNGDETGIDCGGVCAACPPSCNDTVENGNESDVDCGGSCGSCGDGSSCDNNSDCQSGACNGGSCGQPVSATTCLEASQCFTACNVNVDAQICVQQCNPNNGSIAAYWALYTCAVPQCIEFTEPVSYVNQGCVATLCRALAIACGAL